MQPYLKNATSWLLLFVMAPLLAACSSMPQSASPVVEPPAIPALSPELKREPLPSGSYWANVIKWRKTWDETLKSLESKSEDSKPNTSH